NRGLAGRALDSVNARRIADGLAKTGQIEVLELTKGLEIRATSFVGRFSLGDLIITVQPKLPQAPLTQLLRYAYRLRHLDLYDPVNYAPANWAFQDLLIHQLTAEARGLLTRGLHRDYEITRAALHIPRGRIDFGRYVQGANTSSTALPCIYHPRIEDTLLNQTLLSGLRFACEMTNDPNLRTTIRRLLSTLGASVSTKSLDTALLADCRGRLDRRTTAYESAITIIELLHGDAGVGIEKPAEHLRLSGFLFDMNRFFQALVFRFLAEHLEAFEIEEESRLNDLFIYDPLRNPLRRRTPVPRPDFVIRKNAGVVAVLDAKYRDLWEMPLPREMLYQLALYALGQRDGHRRAVILYPTLFRMPREQAILIRNPMNAMQQAEVILRPINLMDLNELIRGGTSTRRQRKVLANHLAFGEATARTEI